MASESLLLKCHGKSRLITENVERCYEEPCLHGTMPVNAGVNDTEHTVQDIGIEDDVEEKMTFVPCAALSGQNKAIQSLVKVRGEDGKVIVRSSYFLKKSTQVDNQFKENHVDDAASEKCGKVRGEDGKVIVQSSYFLKKSTQVNNQFKDNIVDDAAIEKCGTSLSSFAYRSGSDDCEKKMKVVNKNIITRSCYFQHKPSKGSAQSEKSNNYLVNRSVLSDTHLFGLGEVEGKSPTDEGKEIWSRHLHQNSVSRNNQDNKYEMLLEEDRLGRDREEHAAPQITSFCNDIQECPTKKRKARTMDYVETVCTIFPKFISLCFWLTTRIFRFINLSLQGMQSIFKMIKVCIFTYFFLLYFRKMPGQRTG